MEPDDAYASNYKECQIMKENEFWNSWVHYLQMLNGLCAATARLSSNFRGLSVKLGSDFYSKESPRAVDWETLLQALSEATASVHAQTMTAVKSLSSNPQDHTENPYQIRAIENILSLIAFQYRFCMMSCEKLCNIAESGHGKFMPDFQEMDTSALINRISNLGITPSCHGPDNSVSSLYNTKNDYSVHSSLNNSRINLERSIGDPVENSFYYYSQNPCVDNAISAQKDVCKVNNKDRFPYDNKDNSFGLFSPFSLYTDSRQQQPAKNRVANFSNSPYGSDSSHGSTGKFFDQNRSHRFSNNLQGSFQNKFLHKNSLARNPIGFCAPVVSEMSQHNQLAQLRRWSEAAAQEGSERQDDSGNIRRWSVPWDGGQPAIPNETTYWSGKNKFNSKEKDWTDDQDSLDTAIFLLSCRAPQKVSGMSDKQHSILDQFPKLPNVVEGVSQGYSVWGTNGIFPFLQLTESPEQ